MRSTLIIPVSSSSSFIHKIYTFMSVAISVDVLCVFCHIFSGSHSCIHPSIHLPSVDDDNMMIMLCRDDDDGCGGAGGGGGRKPLLLNRPKFDEQHLFCWCFAQSVFFRVVPLVILATFTPTHFHSQFIGGWWWRLAATG